VPTTEVIVKACQWFPDAYLTEKWMQLWRCASLRSLATHLVADRRLAEYISDDDERLLRRRFMDLLEDVHRPRPIYSELRGIVNKARSAHELTRFMDDRRWDDLEDVVAELSSIYRDEHAPRYHGEPHIRVLSWGRESIEILLRHRLERLDRAYIMAPDLSDDSVTCWLGMSTVETNALGSGSQRSTICCGTHA
jgi:hypothetical protein